MGGYGVLVAQNVRHAFFAQHDRIAPMETHQRCYSTQRRGTAGQSDRVWYTVLTSALVRLEIMEELE